MDLHEYKINKDMNEKNIDMYKKTKIVDGVSELSKKMKLKHASLPEENFGWSVPNNRLFNMGKPTQETMINRKKMSFAGIVE